MRAPGQVSHLRLIFPKTWAPAPLRYVSAAVIPALGLKGEREAELGAGIKAKEGAGSPIPPGQHCPLQGHWAGQGQALTLQLSALAKNGEGMMPHAGPFLI